MLSAHAGSQDGFIAYDFEQDEVGEVPTGWFVPTKKWGDAAAVTEDDPASGKRCVMLTRHTDPEAREGDEDRPTFANLMQTFEAMPYHGTRVRFRAAVRVEPAEESSKAQLWLRVDQPEWQMGFFDNMGTRPITSPEWDYYEIVGDIADTAEDINIGVMMVGDGTLWIDDGTFEVVGEIRSPEPARPLTERGLANLVAFTRLLGYVRHFHPSDEAADTDWGEFAVEGVRSIEEALDSHDLCRRLGELFDPVAPTIRVFVTGDDPPLPAELDPPDRGTLDVLAWSHFGLGTDFPGAYHSARVTNAEEDFPPELIEPADVFRADLGAGISCSVPLSLYADRFGTLPHGEPVEDAEPEIPRPTADCHTGDDRATRLAAAALAWNVLQHFYPYFDVVDAHWPEALAPALSAAATDANGLAFIDTLRRLVARLGDGHAGAAGGVLGGAHGYVPPLVLRCVGDDLVVTHVLSDDIRDIRPGDAVVAIDGQPTTEAIAEHEELTSGPTPRLRRHRCAEEILAGLSGIEVAITVRSPAGDERTAIVRRTVPLWEREDPRGSALEEVAPGVIYLNLCAMAEDALDEALPELEAATGIIADVRGYPTAAGALIAHLIDEPVTSPQWLVPRVSYPDQEHMEFEVSHWDIQPETPRLRARTAFLADELTMGSGETYLSIVEHYRLAEIVGEPSGGTNGNVNSIALPGGYRVMFTGMKVLKHDGSQHHGVGIRPTVPVSPTIHGIAEGRDEILERAIEVVGG